MKAEALWDWAEKTRHNHSDPTDKGVALRAIIAALTPRITPEMWMDTDQMTIGQLIHARFTLIDEHLPDDVTCYLINLRSRIQKAMSP
jgi:hypothetical protein